MGLRHFINLHIRLLFELLQSARDILRCTSSCPLFGDITGLLPDSVRTWATQPDMVIERLKDRIIDGRVQLADAALCHRKQDHHLIDMGDVVVSGIPCEDYSSYGSHRGLAGPTGLLVVIWVRLMQQHVPRFIVIEEVKPFLKKCLPLLVRSDMLGSLYSFSYECMDPRLLNLPVGRPRLYCILARKLDCTLSRPLSDMRSTIPPLAPLDRTGMDYYYSADGAPSITLHLQRNLADYVLLYGFEDNAFDLTQTPSKRPRTLLQSLALPVITRSCRLFSTRHHRLLTGIEALVAQGWPPHSAHACYDPDLLSRFARLRPSTTTSLAGNGMHLGCIGLVLTWILHYGVNRDDAHSQAIPPTPVMLPVGTCTLCERICCISHHWQAIIGGHISCCQCHSRQDRVSFN